MLGMEVLAPLSPRRKKDTDAKADGDKRDLRKSDAPQDTVGRKANDKEKESLRQDGEAVEADTPEIQYRWDEGLQRSVVKAATLDKLIHRFTSSRYDGRNPINAFLLSYRLFITPTELLNKMIQRYTTKDAKDTDDFSVVQLRVLAFLKIWVELQVTDFEDEQGLADQLQAFLIGPQVSVESHKAFATQIQRAMARAKQQLAERIRKEQSFTFESLAPGEVPPPFLEVDESELALHLTWIEAGHYYRIKPKECLSQNWNKKGKEELAPNISAMIQRFNLVVSWITGEICSQILLKQRITTIEKFISLGKHLLDLGNFNGVMEVVAGLHSAPVQRLKKTWEGVNKHSLATFESLGSLMGQEHNYKIYRTTLRSAKQPLLPYLGVGLTDLTFLDQGFPTHTNGLINFQKLLKIEEQVRHILYYQEEKYPNPTVGTPRGKTRRFVASIKAVPENESWTMSLSVEPRNTEEAIEKLLLEQAQLKKQNQDLQIAKTYAEELIAQLQSVIENQQRQINELTKKVSGSGRFAAPPQPPPSPSLADDFDILDQFLETKLNRVPMRPASVFSPQAAAMAAQQAKNALRTSTNNILEPTTYSSPTLTRAPSARDLLPIAMPPPSATSTPPPISPRMTEYGASPPTNSDGSIRTLSPRRDDNNSPARVFTRSVSPQANSGKMLRGVLGIGMRDSPVRKPPAAGEDASQAQPTPSVRESGVLRDSGTISHPLSQSPPIV